VGDERFFATMPLSNRMVLCVGGITRRETIQAQDDGVDVEGKGYYLFLASANQPKNPIRLLAKFFTPLEAEAAVRLFTPHSADF
jgi:hypothetical protein